MMQAAVAAATEAARTVPPVFQAEYWMLYMLACLKGDQVGPRLPAHIARIRQAALKGELNLETAGTIDLVVVDHDNSALRRLREQVIHATRLAQSGSLPQAYM